MLIAAIFHKDVDVVDKLLDISCLNLPNNILTTPDSSGRSAIALQLGLVQNNDTLVSIKQYISYCRDKGQLPKVSLDISNFFYLSANLYVDQWTCQRDIVSFYGGSPYEGPTFDKLLQWHTTGILEIPDLEDLLSISDTE